jgi:hypothetical protein
MIFVGIIEIILSSIWFSKYYDLSQAILYILGGCFILVFASVVESMKRHKEDLSKLHSEVLELQRVATEHEKRLN